MPQPYKVFTIYAREDASYLEELRGQLRPLEIASRIKVWSDREINPGVDWEKEIVQNLDTADIILILVSSAYYNSVYIHEKEIKYAMLRHERGEAKVLPIIVRPCSFGDDPNISRLQVLPTDGKPVNDRRHWQERDDAWLDVVLGIKVTIDILIAEENRKTQAELDLKQRQAEEALEIQKEVEQKHLLMLKQKEEKERERQAVKDEIERFKKDQDATVKRLKEQQRAIDQSVLEKKKEKEVHEKTTELENKNTSQEIEKEQIIAVISEYEPPEKDFGQPISEGLLPLQSVYAQDKLKDSRLEQEDAYQLADNAAWQEAIKANDKNAYQIYLYYFPQGNYVKAARQKINETRIWMNIPVNGILFISGILWLFLTFLFSVFLYPLIPNAHWLPYYISLGASGILVVILSVRWTMKTKPEMLNSIWNYIILGLKTAGIASIFTSLLFYNLLNHIILNAISCILTATVVSIIYGSIDIRDKQD